ncbi:MAG: glycosyltransferase [Bacteroidales bacterium]|nr:glycosyltransferase [Bacteroidales bacterium]
MTVSIITASYNNIETIESTIQSVLTQTYPNIEYIIVDGGSTDGTVDVIRRFDSAVANWVSEPDKGLYYALNKGIAMASGDVIGFLHADDVLHDLFVIASVMKLFLEKKCEAVYGDLVYVARNDMNNLIRFWKSCPFHPKLLRQGWMPPHPTLFVHRKIYEQLGTFNTEMRIAADYDMVLRFFKHPDFHSEYLPHVLVRMRMGGISNKNLVNMLRKSMEDYKAMKNNRIGGFKSLVWKNLSKLSQLRIFSGER